MKIINHTINHYNHTKGSEKPLFVNGMNQLNNMIVLRTVFTSCSGMYLFKVTGE